jgi:hypothetical protein
MADKGQSQGTSNVIRQGRIHSYRATPTNRMIVAKAKDRLLAANGEQPGSAPEKEVLA